MPNFDHVACNFRLTMLISVSFLASLFSNAIILWNSLSQRSYKGLSDLLTLYSQLESLQLLSWIKEKTSCHKTLWRRTKCCPYHSKNPHFCCWSSLKRNLSWPIHSWLAGRRRRPFTPHPTLLPSPTIISNWSVVFSDHWNYHVVKVSRR